MLMLSSRLLSHTRHVVAVGLLCVVATGLWARDTSAQTDATDPTPFHLQGGERILFFGDSITQAGTYIEYIETYLATRFPHARFTVINHGISSETISGTTEPDHVPPRPDAKLRFARDVADHEPDVVVACFGMNDGNYFPPDEEKFAAYRNGIEWLIEHVEATGSRLTILTPPPFDPYQRKNSDPEAVAYGYRYPAVNYDDTLAMFSDYLRGLRGPDRVVVDVHSALNAHLRERRKERVSFHLSPDAVHPNPTGHWLMAMQLLDAWRAPSLVSEVHVDLTQANRKFDALAPAEPGVDVESGPAIRGAKATELGVEFTWNTRLPMPLDPRWDMKSVVFEKTSDRLNRHRIQVTGFEPDTEYLFFADGEPIARVTGTAFAKGVDLTLLPAFPTTKRSLELLALIQQRQKLQYTAWRRGLPDAATGPPSETEPTRAETTALVASLTRQIQELATPMDVQIRIVKAFKTPEPTTAD